MSIIDEMVKIYDLRSRTVESLQRDLDDYTQSAMYRAACRQVIREKQSKLSKNSLTSNQAK